MSIFDCGRRCPPLRMPHRNATRDNANGVTPQGTCRPAMWRFTVATNSPAVITIQAKPITDRSMRWIARGLPPMQLTTRSLRC
jgi:hypothetical protein